MRRKSILWKIDACCWLALAAFVIDRLTKLWAQSALRGQPPMDVWPGIFRLIYVENTGAAFGMLQGRQVFLLILTGVALSGLFWWLLTRASGKPPLLRAALWLLFGGAMGNFADRLFLGAVVDFMEIRLFSFPVFNVADCCVSFAFVLISGFILFGKEARTDAG